MRDIEYEHEEGEELDSKRIFEIKKHVLLEHLRTDPYWIRLRKKLIARKFGKGYKPTKRTEEQQRDAFERIYKKEKIHPEDWKDEFCLYWIGFLKGEYKSINQYLNRKKFTGFMP